MFAKRLTLIVGILFLLLSFPSNGFTEWPERTLVIHNNTDATLFVTVNDVRTETAIPANQKRSLVNLLCWGHNIVVINAKCVAPLPNPLQKTIWVSAEGRRTREIYVFSRDFGKTVMFDAPRCEATTQRLEATCNRILGQWRWFTGNEVEFFNNHRWSTLNGTQHGWWVCNTNGSVTVGPDTGTGRWRDTVTVHDDWNSLSGTSQWKPGVRVTATRLRSGRGGSSQRDCPQCNIYDNWLKTNQKVCGYQDVRLPSICEADSNCVYWNKECNRVRQLLKDCLDQCHGGGGYNPYGR